MAPPAGSQAPGGARAEACAPNGIDWAAAREEYFYLHKVMATELGEHGCDQGSEQHKYMMYRTDSVQDYDGNEEFNWEATLRANGGWLRLNADPLVTHNALCNTDIRSHLLELFTFSLFFSPRTIVELGVRTGWSTRAIILQSPFLVALYSKHARSPTFENFYQAFAAAASCSFGYASLLK
jgi:hypothetical protein